MELQHALHVIHEKLEGVWEEGGRRTADVLPDGLELMAT